jgi:hypothetical protein
MFAFHILSELDAKPCSKLIHNTPKPLDSPHIINFTIFQLYSQNKIGLSRPVHII